jgi:hypothetical protein
MVRKKLPSTVIQIKHTTAYLIAISLCSIVVRFDLSAIALLRHRYSCGFSIAEDLRKTEQK